MSPFRRLLLCSAFAVVAVGCDGYIEQVSVNEAGAIEFLAEATVVCTDPGQAAIWGADPCGAIDAAARGADPGPLPFGFEVDADRVAFVSDGDLDRRRIDVRWEGDAAGLATPMIASAAIRTLDAERTELVLVLEGAALSRVRTDPELIDATERWPEPELRVVTPGRITEHDADRIQGRTVIYTLAEPTEQVRVVWTSAGPGLRLWWVLVGSVVFGIVLFMMVVLESPRSAPPTQRDD
ncbi:MAG: hypothetical protein ACR2P0_16225 [Acidimicrobiales bacterium]